MRVLRFVLWAYGAAGGTALLFIPLGTKGWLGLEPVATGHAARQLAMAGRHRPGFEYCLEPAAVNPAAAGVASLRDRSQAGNIELR